MKLFSTLVLSLLILSATVKAQYFVSDIQVAPGPTLIFQAKPVGGNITSRLMDVEFFLRWNSSYGNSVVFSTPTVNTTDFPGLTITRLNNDVSDPGYYNVHFIYNAAFSGMKTYTNGTAYEVFRVTLSGSIPGTVELVADNTNGVPYYFTIQGVPGDFGAVPSGDFTPYFPTSPIITPTGSTGSFFYKSFGNGTLPITLKSFTGKVINCKGMLEWVSSSETNSKYYEVQQSTDGINFTAVANVPATNNGSVDHTYAQQVPLTAATNYYRLKMVTIDDVPKYSLTVTLLSGTCTVVATTPTDVQVYPNPVVNHVVSLTISGYTDKKVDIRLEDAAGKLIKIYSHSLTTGQNQFSLQLPGIAEGMYILKITGENNGTVSKKIFVE